MRFPFKSPWISILFSPRGFDFLRFDNHPDT